MTKLPWDDPNHDVMKDIVEFRRKSKEEYYKMRESRLQLGFDSTASDNYPHGYWYAYIAGTNYELEAIGPTVEAVLATLVNEAIKALDERYQNG